MVLLVFFLEPAQDRDRVLDRRLLDHDRLEPAGKGGVLFDMLAVLVERRGTHTMQLAAGKSRLEQIGRIHCAIGLAGTHERVHLVDEQDDLAVMGLDFGENGLQAFLELTAIFRAGNQRAHVERHQPLVFERFRHVAIDDPERQTFRDCRLADAGFTDQDRVVLGAPRQHLDRTTDFVVTPDHRIKLALAGDRGEIAGIFLQRVETLFGRGRIGRAALADIVDRLVERLRGDAGARKRLRRRGRAFDGKRLKQAFHRDETVTGLLGGFLGSSEYLGDGLGQIELAVSARYLGKFGQGCVIGEARVSRTTAGAFDQRCRHALIVVEQDFKHMFGSELLMALCKGPGLCGLDESADSFRIFLDIHMSLH